MIKKDAGLPKQQFRSLLNGVLEQDKDQNVEFKKDMKLADEKVEGIEIAGKIHDLGKINISAEILNKPKTGFGLPIAKWFRNELAPMLKETLLDETSERRGLFEQHLLKKMVSEHIEGRRDWANRLWAFLFLELWFREFID